MNFEPEILLPYKKQIYWNEESYLHVVLRHVKQMQIGNFKNKTAFPYKFEDLSNLIQKVLGVVGDEIKNQYSKYPNKPFRRIGKMSVLFNGDYYCIRIDATGRLETLYVNE